MGPLFRVFLGIWAGYLLRPFEPAGAGLTQEHILPGQALLAQERITCPNAWKIKIGLPNLK